VPSPTPATPSRAPIPIADSGIEADRSRSGSSVRGADIVPPPTPRGRSISSIRAPIREDSPVTTKDSRPPGSQPLAQQGRLRRQDAGSAGGHSRRAAAALRYAADRHEAGARQGLAIGAKGRRTISIDDVNAR
jgi:hypothetical protein